MAVAEHRLKGQLLVQHKAHWKGHLSAPAVAHKYNVAAFFRHMDCLNRGNLRARRLNCQIASLSFCQPHHFFHSVRFASVNHSVRSQLQCFFQTFFHDIHHINLRYAHSL